MPTPALAAMAKDAGVSLSDAERYWDDAKDQAQKAGKTDDWEYIMGIVKARMGMKEWDYPMDVHFQESFDAKRHLPDLEKQLHAAGFSVEVEVNHPDNDGYYLTAKSKDDKRKLDTWFYHHGYSVDTMGGGLTLTAYPDESDHPELFHEEITTTANLGVGNIAQTRPDQDQPFVCSSCGYGADKDLGGTCPKCGGRMAARESWIREIIRRVESGESPREVLSSLLR